MYGVILAMAEKPGSNDDVSLGGKILIVAVLIAWAMIPVVWYMAGQEDRRIRKSGHRAEAEVLDEAKKGSLLTVEVRPGDHPPFRAKMEWDNRFESELEKHNDVPVFFSLGAKRAVLDVEELRRRVKAQKLASEQAKTARAEKRRARRER